MDLFSRESHVTFPMVFIVGIIIIMCGSILFLPLSTHGNTVTLFMYTSMPQLYGN